MPVEIRELVIRTTVDEDKKGRKKSGGNSLSKEQIINEVVDKVVEMIKQEKER
jgi:hypothetical protein